MGYLTIIVIYILVELVLWSKRYTDYRQAKRFKKNREIRADRIRRIVEMKIGKPYATKEDKDRRKGEVLKTKL